MRLLLILSLLLTSTFSIKSISDKEVEELLTKSDESHIGIFGKDVSEEFISKVTSQLAGLFLLYQINSQSIYVQENGFLVLPFGTQEEKLTTKKEFIETDFKFNDVIVHLDTIMENSIDMISSGYIQEYLKFKVQQENKFVFVLFDSNMQKKQLAYRTISKKKEFKNQFYFVQSAGKLDSIKETFKIEKFPTLLCFYPTIGKDEDDQTAGLSVIPYRGTMNFEPMNKFVELVSTPQFKAEFLKNLKKKEGEKDSNENDTPVFDDKIIIQAIGQHDPRLLDICNKVICIIAFDNFWIGGEERFSNTVNILKGVQSKFSNQGLKVILLDGGCHNYLLPDLNLQLESLPGLIIYNAKVNEFHHLMGKFNTDDILSFILKIQSGAHKPLKMKGKLELKHMDCEKEMNRLEKLTEKQESTPEEDALTKEAIENARRNEEEKKFKKDNKKRRSSEL